MSLETRLRRLEGHVHPGELELIELKEWVRTLDTDDPALLHRVE